MEDTENAQREIAALELDLLAGKVTFLQLGSAMHEALRVARGGTLEPWKRSAAGHWVREARASAPVCMVIGSVALLPAGHVMIWDFGSEDAAKTAIDQKLERFWGQLNS